jgi:hypothetical protein
MLIIGSIQVYFILISRVLVRARLRLCVPVGRVETVRYGMPLVDVPGLQIFNAEWLPLQMPRAYRIRQKVVAVGLRRGEAQR